MTLVSAVLTVDPQVGERCPLVRSGPNAPDITQQFVRDETGWTVCHATVTPVEGETKYVTQPIREDCYACAILHRAKCLSSFESIDNGAFVVSVIVRKRSQVGPLVETLEKSGATVTLESIGELGGYHETRVIVDESDITPKQRDALQVAYEVGYYDDSANGSLKEVADRLGVSKSAASQRLTVIETMLMRNLASNWFPSENTD